ncbi:DUF4181 domain-containing protein [Gracilibacillus halotolerans]|uniref:DUF4181 domain-containing protein n=1 Tax=Gracilibacillus halotolerans TaxID=74386 RepID=UPI0016128C25
MDCRLSKTSNGSCEKILNSYNHINDTHKKWDWIIRAIFIAFFFTLLIIYSINNSLITTIILQPWLIIIIFIFTSGVTRGLLKLLQS